MFKYDKTEKKVIFKFNMNSCSIRVYDSDCCLNSLQIVILEINKNNRIRILKYKDASITILQTGIIPAQALNSIFLAKYFIA
jgi:hypothetical protein